MLEVRDREPVIVTPASDGGAGAAAMVILALILVAVIGYMVYAFNGNPRTVIERDTNTTVNQPVAVPSPAPAPTPAPAPSDNPAPSADSTGNK